VEVEEVVEAAANLEERLNFHPAAKNKRKKERKIPRGDVLCINK
jgi:predicted neutral ceramidase superfamily lipid hydrolase